MWQWFLQSGLPWLLRSVAAAVALGLLYVALFLYEDEEKRVRSRLEDVWVRIDEAARQASSRQVAFIRQVADVTESWFGVLLGPRLLSLRVVIVSAFLSVTSWSLFAALSMIVFALQGEPMGPMETWGTFAVGLPLWLVAWRLIRPRPHMAGPEASDVVHSASVPTGRYALPSAYGCAAAVMCAMTVLLLLSVVSDWVRDGRVFSQDASAVYGTFTGMLIVGFAGDFLVIAAVRRILRVVSSATSLVYSVLLLLAPVVLALVVFVWPLVFAALAVGDGNKGASIIAVFIASANFIDALASTAFAFVGIALLLHRLVRPLLPRIVYAVIRYDLLGQKKLLAGAALGMLAAAIPGATGSIKTVADVFGARMPNAVPASRADTADKRSAGR